MSKTETKIIKGIVTEFVKNRFGVEIKMCCSSCEHHGPCGSDYQYRKCTRHDTVVDKSSCCKDWAISEAMDKIKLRRQYGD